MFTRICITSLIVLANSLTAIPAKAELLPYLFASTFCEARRAGLSQDDALRIAYHQANTSKTNLQTIIVGGNYYKSDEFMAFHKAAEMCPKLIK